MLGSQPFRKNFLRASFVLAAAFVLGVGFNRFVEPEEAQAFQSGTKIGFVDLYRVRAESQSIQSVLKKIDDDTLAKQQQADLLARELRRMMQEADAQASALSAEQRRQKETEIRAKQDELNDLGYEIERMQRRATVEVVEPSLDRIVKAVEQVAKDEGYGLVLSKDSVLYGAGAHELTPLVIRELDRGFKPPATSPVLPK